MATEAVNPFMNQGVYWGQYSGSKGVNQQPPVNPISPSKGSSSSQGIPKEAYNKFSRDSLSNFDVSNCNPFQPETRTEDKGQTIYMLG